MVDQEKLKIFFRKLIDETENNKFVSTEELVEYIAEELQKMLFATEKR